MEKNQKKQPAKRIQLVDVVLERKGSQLFSGRRVRSPEDAANIIRDFIGDCDRKKFVVLGLLMGIYRLNSLIMIIQLRLKVQFTTN